MELKRKSVIPSKDKIKKSVLIEPALWLKIEAIMEDENCYINDALNLLLDMGVDQYDSIGIRIDEPIKSTQNPMPWLYDDK